MSMIPNITDDKFIELALNCKSLTTRQFDLDPEFVKALSAEMKSELESNGLEDIKGPFLYFRDGLLEVVMLGH